MITTQTTTFVKKERMQTCLTKQMQNTRVNEWSIVLPLHIKKNSINERKNCSFN